VPTLLKVGLHDLSKNDGHFSILDLGCGDGQLLFALQHEGFLRNVERVVGVDISEIRIRRLLKNVKNVIGLVSDACNVEELDDETFDVIICSQLIEHVAHDRVLLREIRRLLSDDGFVYISSVIKKSWGFWLYRRDGEFRLDPTHVREYPSEKAFVSLLQQEGFIPRKVVLNKIKYPVEELLIRGLIRLRLYKLKEMPTVYEKEKFLKIPLFGYEGIEVLANI